MSDDPTAPAEELDTATTDDDAPDEGQAPEAEQGEDINLDDFDLSQVPDDAGSDWFQEKYQGLRSDYTRKTQTLAEERKQVQGIVEAIRDPQHPNHSEVMEYLGLEEVTDDPDDDDLDEDDPQSDLEKRLAAIEADREQARQTAAQKADMDAADQALADGLATVQNREGIEEFTQDELVFLVNTAVARSGDPKKPDVEGAYKALKGLYANDRKRHVQSKKAPRQPGSGVPASRELDISDRSARLEVARAAAERAMAE